jgi:hypothetical protein
MQKYKTISDIIALAEFAHRNQTDKAGLPYIEHPKRVLEKVKAQGAMPYVQMAAILHDVTEDTAFTPEILLALGIPEPAIEIVKLLDRDYSEARHKDLIIHCHRLKDRRDEWIGAMSLAWQNPVEDFYYSEIKPNRGALMIKLADIEDNLSQWRLEYLPMETQIRLQKKYAKARKLLGWNPPPWEIPSYIIGGTN